MKYLYLVLSIACTTTIASAQNVGIGTNSPNTKAILEIKSSNSGLLVPRMNSANRLGINPALSESGLLVYDVNLQQFMYYNGAEWTGLSTDTSVWQTTGNDIYYANGKVGIGLTTPLYTTDIKSVLDPVALRVQNDMETGGSTYAIQAINTLTGAGSKYGVYSQVASDLLAAGPMYGVFSTVTTTTSDQDAYGGYFTVDTTGSGTHYGVFAKARGPGNYGLYAESQNADGWAAYFLGRAVITSRLGIGIDTPQYKLDIETANRRGINVQSSSASGDTAWGIYNRINPAGTGVRFGVYSKVTPDESNDNKAYGLFGAVDSVGTGQHVGVLGRALGDDNVGVQGRGSGSGIGVKGINTDDGWAGYFDGKTYVEDRVEIRDKIFLRPTGHASGGEIELFDDIGQQTVTIRAGQGVDQGSEMDMYDNSGTLTVNLDGDRSGQGGALKLYDEDGDLTVKIHAAQSTTNGSEMLMYNDAGELTIELDADWGSGNGRVITDELQITGGADLSENFDLLDKNVTPGMLVSIDDAGSGKLVQTTQAYDRSVVGVVSGAGGIRAGMLMGQEESIANGTSPVALVGRVYVLADARSHPVRAGDLMTSSATPGHAMAVRKYRKARGAIIGKALTSLEKGTGYVLILVNLQ